MRERWDICLGTMFTLEQDKMDLEHVLLDLEHELESARARNRQLAEEVMAARCTRREWDAMWIATLEA